MAVMMIAQLLQLAEIYCTATGRSMARVSTLIFNDGKKFALLARGTDLNTRSFESAMQWFSDNWPADADWPEAVLRPEPVCSSGVA